MPYENIIVMHRSSVMCVGWVVLALFAEGLLRLIGVIDPVFPWLKIIVNYEKETWMKKKKKRQS